MFWENGYSFDYTYQEKKSYLWLIFSYDVLYDALSQKSCGSIWFGKKAISKSYRFFGTPCSDVTKSQDKGERNYVLTINTINELFLLLSSHSSVLFYISPATSLSNHYSPATSHATNRVREDIHKTHITLPPTAYLSCFVLCYRRNLRNCPIAQW